MSTFRPSLTGLLCAGAFSLLVGAACSDDAAGTAATGGAPSTDRDQGLDPGPVGGAPGTLPGAGGSESPATDAGPAGGDVPPSGDAGPQFIDLGPAEPECFDENCAAGQVCYEGVCIDGTRCDGANPCPGGRICVDGLCVGDPVATGGLVAEPDQLLFSYSDVGQSIRYTTTLINRGDDILNVTALNVVGSPTFTLPEPPALPLRLVPEQSHDLIVQFDPDDLAPENAVLQAITDVQGAPPVEVLLQSDHKQVGGLTPCLRVVPAQVNFGFVQRGNVAHQNVDLLSCGEAPVTVLRIDRGRSFLGELSQHFDIANPPAFPAIIQPGQRLPLDMTYAPGRAGIESGFWEVRSNDPATPTARIDVSAIAAPPPLENVGLHIRVSWNTDLTDVDTHVIAPGGQMWTCEGDCYFSNPNPNWGDPNRWEDDPFLDTDDVDGFGPENVNIQDPIPGTYTVLIHYWDTHGGNTPDTEVEVLTFNNRIGSYGPVSTPNVDDVWRVVEIDWPGPVVRPLGGVRNEPRGALCGGF
jgi:hypothetical protein